MKDATAKAYAGEVVSGDAPDLVASWPATVEAMLEPIYRFVRARAPAEAVDDLVQETFVAASRALRQFDGRCPLWNWLTAIARNKIADHYRRSGGRDLLAGAVDVLNAEDTQVARALLSEAALPEEICGRRELQALARAALSALSPEQQECLVGRYYEDLSLEELSRRLHASRTLVNSRLHRARQALRQAMLGMLNPRSRIGFGDAADDRECLP